MTTRANSGPQIIEGDLDGSNLRIRIVASKYNRAVVDALVEGALKTLLEHDVRDEDITVVRVPGAFEIPLALRQALHLRELDAQIALGCVIQGETAHFDQVVHECSRATMDTIIALDMPIAYGVLAVNNIEQALARSGGLSNRGEEAALAALEFTRLLRRWPALLL